MFILPFLIMCYSVTHPSVEDPIGLASEKVSRRDPRLQKLKEKQEKSLLYQPPPVVAVTPKLPVKKCEVSPSPIISLDLSKDKICQETLQQVDEEMKAIAVTVFPKVSVDTSQEDKSKVMTPKKEFYKKNLDVSQREHPIKTQREVKSQEIHTLSKPQTATIAKTKMVPQPKIAGSCFDFLTESKPKEKSFKYLSKREELSRKQAKKAKEKSDSVPECHTDSTKDLIEIKQNIYPRKITQDAAGEKKPSAKIPTDNEEGRKKHSKKRSSEKEEHTISRNSNAQKKKKKKKEKKHPDRHERREVKPRRESPSVECEATLTCKLCQEEFSLSKSYRRHFKTAHIYKCSKCPLKFNSEEKQKSHSYKNHGQDSKELQKTDEVETIDSELAPQINICSLCGDSFRTSLELTDHISSPHIAPCFDCDFMFVDFQSLLNHKKSHASHTEEVSKPVNSTLSTSPMTNKLEAGENTEKKKRKKVKVEALSEMAVIRDVADLIMIDAILIERSKETPSEQNREPDIKKGKLSEEHHCKSCEKVFTTEKDLFHHSTFEHFENWSFTDADKNAKRKQTGWTNDGESEGPFVCNLCSEVFKLWGSLLKHLWAPHFFACEYCGKSFNRNTKLEDHVNKEHDFVGLIDTTKCGLCGETFGRSSSLARHINSPHTFPCSRCPLRFPIKSALTKHKKNCTRNKMKDILEDCINQIPS